MAWRSKACLQGDDGVATVAMAHARIQGGGKVGPTDTVRYGVKGHWERGTRK